MIYYKVLNDDGTPFHGGIGQWSLPEGDKPGKWMPPIENLELCASGYHVINKNQLIEWIGPTIFEVEVKGKFIHDANKSVFESARLIRKIEAWNDKTARLFAADCAERVLPFYESEYPNDSRPRLAIDATRKFANGEITQDKLNAARSAARSAARTWQTERLFEYLDGRL